MNKINVMILGGDLRQYYMAKLLEKESFAIFCFGKVFDQIGKCQTVDQVWEIMKNPNTIIVLPVPVSVDGIYVKGTEEQILLEEVASHIAINQRIYGGNIPDVIRKQVQIKQGKLMDFMELDQIAVKNAVATAEGTIAEAMQLGTETIQGSESLVIGFGRCGEILADKLSALKANVTVMARSERAKVKAETHGYHVYGMEFKNYPLIQFQYIYNTVPAKILDDTFLKSCNDSVTIIDIASSPGGVDYLYATKHQINAKICLGLPGKYAPKTAGEILAEEIEKELS